MSVLLTQYSFHWQASDQFDSLRRASCSKKKKSIQIWLPPLWMPWFRLFQRMFWNYCKCAQYCVTFDWYVLNVGENKKRAFFYASRRCLWKYVSYLIHEKLGRNRTQRSRQDESAFGQSTLLCVLLLRPSFPCKMYQLIRTPTLVLTLIFCFCKIN